MRNRIGAAVAIMVVAAVNASSARADVDAGQVVIAYSDGYTTTDGQFHAWEHRSDAEAIRAKHADKYRPWRHDDPRHKDDH